MIHEEFVLTAAHCVIGNFYNFNENSIQNIDDIDGFLNSLIYDSDVRRPMQVKIGLISQRDPQGKKTYENLYRVLQSPI